jgi:hypothetical protein
MSELKDKYEDHCCDYCGDWTMTFMMEVWRDNKIVWKICEPCWIKAFDKVLGRPGDSK